MRCRRVGGIAAATVATGLALTIGVHAYTAFGSWASSSVVYYINPANLDVPASAALAAVQAGADTWGSQSAADFRFVYGGRVSDTTVGFDQRPVVIFRNASKDNALATTYSWYSGTTLIDADIIFWDGAFKFFTGSSGCSGGAYIEDIAAHEFGHALGLKHSDDGDATMYPSYSWCSLKQRTLGADDIAGVEFLYPRSGSNSPPTVAILAPADNSSYPQGTSITFTGSATDKEDGNLSSAIAWRSSLDGSIGSGASVSRALSVGTHTITASVTDSRGVSTSRQTTTKVNAAANSAPSVRISAPENGTTFVQGGLIMFSGSATDQEDGNLSHRLVWTSSLDGPLGKGSSLSMTLSAGTHTVEAAASDSGGLSGSSRIVVNVTAVPDVPPPSTTISLSAQGYKIKGGLHRVDLRWSGATSATVNVYRDGVRVFNTQNDGAETDRVDRKGRFSYTYVVCEAGTVTCSNAVRVGSD